MDEQMTGRRLQTTGQRTDRARPLATGVATPGAVVVSAVRLTVASAVAHYSFNHKGGLN